ncbi:MAG: M20/M25/M40 family metallo-hydrolase [Spirochaetota bacterium]
MVSKVLSLEFSNELSNYLNTQAAWVREALSHSVSIPSVSGSEKEMVAFFHELLTTMKGEVYKEPVSEILKNDPDYITVDSKQPYSERPNLVHLKRGKNQGRSLIMCGHADVVPGAGKEAFVPRLEGEYLYGRGACDDKGPLVAWLLALKGLDYFGLEPAGNLETHIVIEEEVGGNGALSLILGGRITAESLRNVGQL